MSEMSQTEVMQTLADPCEEKLRCFRAWKLFSNIKYTVKFNLTGNS